jgi:hypothetical protein
MADGDDFGDFYGISDAFDKKVCFAATEPARALVTA